MLKDDQPRHEQISNWLRKAIEGGEFSPQDKLPSESEIGKKFDVSRVTVRHALRTLENEGLIYRKQGLGSFVSKEQIHQPLVRLEDFMEEMKKAGLKASSDVISFQQTKSTQAIGKVLEVETGSPLMRLDRVRLGNEIPIAFDVTWLPMFYGQLLNDHNLENDTIYNILEKVYQIPIVSGRYRISAVNADAYISDHLKVKKATALLLIERISRTIGRKKVYFQQRYYRTDRMSYEVFLERSLDQEKGGKEEFPLKEFAPVFNSEN